ncbi:DegQ family serine endoprotease [uncultured Thiocystis sp.]|jgi:serine protease DegQ|uniref:DegQ family serine endoprotease n=1 Tax=uncultured Thiocystis sp. TaxID=1202134 RepID=UPI0025E2A2BA|nr:DegQ family serine endoprotease [uncultured Thiocystis sp.]
MTFIQRLVRTFLLIPLLLSAAPSRAGLPTSIDGQPLPSLAPMLDRVVPAVVNISTVSQIETADHPLLRDPFFRHFFDIPQERQQRKSNSLGSGIIVDAKRGLVLTNHHVIAKASEIGVGLHDGRTIDAELIGADPATDVAVLRIPAKDLAALSFADSDALRVGDFVVAIGNPFGLSQTVTSGIVSGLGRTGLGIEGYESFIQTDASINPGNSGGPLVNLRGELVGMNTAILAPGGGNIGIGFAIPANMVRAIMEQLVEHGAVRRGLFGVGVQDLTGELVAAFDLEDRDGALVTSVEKGSAAADAGLREGDIILTVNDKPIRGSADLRNRFGLLRVGERVELEIVRGGKPRRLSGIIADPYRDFVRGDRLSPILAGALFGELDRRVGVPAVPVGTVETDSPAWNAGLREGDRILQVNGQGIDSLSEIAILLRQAGGLLSLRVQRGDDLLLLARR